MDRNAGPGMVAGRTSTLRPDKCAAARRSGNAAETIQGAAFAIVVFAKRGVPCGALWMDGMNTSKLDRVDLRILEELQGNGRLSSADLAERVQLSTSPCWRRVKRLEEVGFIRGYGARLDAALLGYQVTAFVHISLDKKDAASMAAFEAAVQTVAQVLSCHRISGRYDYQLTAVAADLQGYGVFGEAHINSLPCVKEVYTSFVMREVKAPGVLPLPG
jgi:Lrp/AsnC family leucine-responsive transcriptional regulator